MRPRLPDHGDPQSQPRPTERETLPPSLTTGQRFWRTNGLGLMLCIPPINTTIAAEATKRIRAVCCVTILPLNDLPAAGFNAKLRWRGDFPRLWISIGRFDPYRQSLRFGRYTPQNRQPKPSRHSRVQLTATESQQLLEFEHQGICPVPRIPSQMPLRPGES